MTKQNDKPAKAQLKENGSELKQNDPSDKLEQAAEVRMDELVNRFLTWALPKSVCADRCATVYDYPHDRSGTNLLNADEAREMLEHVLSGYRQAEIDELKAKLKRAKWIINQFKLHGSDGCLTCDTGRITLYVTNPKCFSCAPESYVNPFDAVAALGEK